MVLLGKIMILQKVGHPISCLGVCYANDPKKGGYMTLDLTTSLRGDFSSNYFSNKTICSKVVFNKNVFGPKISSNPTVYVMLLEERASKGA